MNRTFKTLWNAVRGQLVPVCEVSSSHSQAGGSKKQGSVCTGSRFVTKRSAMAMALSAAFLAGTAQAAITPPEGWEYDTEELTDITMDFSGGLYGTASPSQKNQHTYKLSETGVIQGGVYYWEEFFGYLLGDPNTTGIASMKRVWNEGTLKDTEQYDSNGDGTMDTAQVGASWRIEELYNKGTFDGRELRIYTNLWNDGSENFSADDFRLQSGANVHNTGTMNFGNVYAGLQNADVTTLEGAQYAANESAKWINEGTVNVTGTFTNYLALEDQGESANWTIAKWDNHANGNVKTVNVTNGLTNAAGAELTIGTLTLAGSSTNAGTLTTTTLSLANGLTNTGTASLGTVTLGDGSSIETSGTFTAGAITGSGTNTLNITNGTADIDSFTGTGTVTNAGTQTDIASLTLTGESTFTNTGTLTGTTLSLAGTGSNSGTLTYTGTATFGGTFTNTGTITGTTMSLAGTADNQGTMTYTGAATIAGTFTNTGTLSANGTKVAQGAHLDLQNGSTATLGNVNLSGTLTVHTANATLGEIAAQSGSTINNDQTLNVALTASDGVTYNQTAGTLTTTNGAWFTNSTLNISGGSLERDTLGTGNDYVISGTTPGSFTDQTKVESGWKDDQTVFTLGTLDSTSDVKLSSGGVLEVETIALTDKTFTFDGGALTASLDQMFDGVTEAAFNINTDEQESINTEVLGATSVAGVSADFGNNLTFTENGGTVVITDDAVTTGAVAGSSTALKALAGDNAANVNVVYTGTITTSTEGGLAFYHDTFTQLKQEQQEAGGSAFIDPGLIFAGMTYANLDTEDGTARDVVTVGASAEGETSYLLDQSIGFKAVTDATTVNVQDGKKFVLVGDASDEISLVGESGGTVNASGEGTVFQLGTTGVVGAKGRLEAVNVSDAASFTTKSGTYAVGALSLAAGTTSTVQDGSNLTVTNATDEAGAKMTNAGSLVYTNAVALKGDYENSKTMTLAAGGSVNGGFKNAKGAEFVSNAALTFGGSSAASNEGTIRQTAGDLTFSRTFTNAEGAKIAATASDITFRNRFTNSGDMAAANISAGTGGVVMNAEGALMYADGTITVDGTGRMLANGTVMADKLDIQGTYLRGNNVVVVTGKDAIERQLNMNAGLKSRVEALGVTVGGSQAAAKRTAAPAAFGIALMAEPAAPEYKLDENATADDVLKFDGEYGNVLSGVEWTGKQGTAISASSEQTAVGNYSVGLMGDTTFSDEAALSSMGTFYVDHALTFNKGTAFENVGFEDDDRGVYATGRTVVRNAMTIAEDVDARFEELWVGADGTFTTASNASGTALRMHGGDFTMTQGFSGWNTADLNAGSIKVAGGTLSFGIAEKDLEGLTDKAAVLALGAGGLAMNDASIAVGTTDAQLGAGDLYFAADSALVFTTTNLDREVPLVSSDGALTVEKGSELVLAGASIGRHYLTDKLDVTGVEEGAWTGDDFVNKTGQEIEFREDENGVYMVVGTEDVRDTNMNVAAVNIVNAVLTSDNRSVDSKDAGIAFISRVLDDTYSGTTDMAAKGEMLNNAMMVGIGSGSDAYALDTVEQAVSAIDSRLSLQTAYRDLTGLPSDGALWAQITGGKSKADDLGAPAGMKAGYDADAYGLMIGGDAQISGGWTLGAAFGYQKGDLDSEGDFSNISTDVESWGIYGYGAKRIGDWNLTAQLGWTQFSSDAETSLAGSMGMGKAEASPDASIISAGIGAEWLWENKDFSIVPHAGLRWLHADFDGYDVEINGASAFEVDGEKADVFQVPVGVSAAAKVRAGRWNVRPFADLTVVGNFGDTDRAYELSSRTLGASDSMNYDLTGDVVGKLSLGVSAHRKAFDLGFKYTGAVGDAGKQSHSFTGEMKWHF